VREGVDRAAATTGCRFTVDVVGARRAWARPVALSRALACVLDNAVRAAGESGAVTVTVVEDSTGTHVRVADTGPGFGRIASRTSLGLTTTRAMVAACQGTFDIRDGRDGGAVADICLGTVGLEAVAS
jgi:signal transduction histidine kinase